MDSFQGAAQGISGQWRPWLTRHRTLRTVVLCNVTAFRAHTHKFGELLFKLGVVSASAGA